MEPDEIGGRQGCIVKGLIVLDFSVLTKGPRRMEKLVLELITPVFLTPVLEGR